MKITACLNRGLALHKHKTPLEHFYNKARTCKKLYKSTDVYAILSVYLEWVFLMKVSELLYATELEIENIIEKNKE